MPNHNDLAKRRKVPLATPTDLGQEARKNISGALNALLADVFALYLKTKNFHWHISGPHFRDYHLLLDERRPNLRYDGWLRALVHIVISDPENEIDCDGSQSLELGIAFMLTDSCQPAA